MGAVGLDTKEERVRVLIVVAFFSCEEGNPILIHQSIMEVDASFRIAFPIVDGPFLGSQGTATKAEREGQAAGLSHGFWKRRRHGFSVLVVQ